jgi:hypothetical protein
MSANATTAMHGQSSNVGPLGAAAVLTAVVAFGALGFMIGKGVTTTTVDRPAAGPVIDNTSMTGPRTSAQKGLGVDSSVYANSLRARGAAAYAGTEFAAQYANFLKVQAAAAAAAFPDMYQRSIHPVGAPYSGTDFAGQYANWLKVQAATANLAFPDYIQRIMANNGTSNITGYSGSDFAGQYANWLKAQGAIARTEAARNAAAALVFPDYFQRHAPVATPASSDWFQRHSPTTGLRAGGNGGRSVRLPQ